MTPYQRLMHLEKTSWAAFATARGALRVIEPVNGTYSIGGPTGERHDLTKAQYCDAFRTVDLQRFLSIIMNFEIFYSDLIGVAKHEMGWTDINPGQLSIWRGLDISTVLRRWLAVEATSAVLDVPEVSSPTLNRLHEYWHVRNQWMHEAGVVNDKFGQRVAGLSKERWFEFPDNRCWVVFEGGPNWPKSPLEQVLCHVNAFAKWIADECEEKHACLKGLIVGRMV